MKFGPQRVQAFKLFFVAFFVPFVLFGVIPSILDYFFAWSDSPPTKEKLLRWVWIVPSLSLIGAFLCALTVKDEAEPSGEDLIDPKK